MLQKEILKTKHKGIFLQEDEGIEQGLYWVMANGGDKRHVPDEKEEQNSEK